MACLNKVQFIGNLGRDPEIRYTQDGKAVANFSLAMTEKYNGNERTEWVNVTAWNKLAEIVKQYLGKGSQVYVEGKLRIEKYQKRDGTEGTKVSVIASNLVMLGRPRSSGNLDYDGEEPGFKIAKPRPVTAQDPITDDDLGLPDNGDSLPF